LRFYRRPKRLSFCYELPASRMERT
jgi:hypothetical protein